jgi:hypothetical protein
MGRMTWRRSERMSIIFHGNGTIPLTIDFEADFIGGHLRLDHEGGIFL